MLLTCLLPSRCSRLGFLDLKHVARLFENLGLKVLTLITVNAVGHTESADLFLN